MHVRRRNILPLRPCTLAAAVARAAQAHRARPRAPHARLLKTSMDGRDGSWMNGWMDGWMDGWIDQRWQRSAAQRSAARKLLNRLPCVVAADVRISKITEMDILMQNDVTDSKILSRKTKPPDPWPSAPYSFGVCLSETFARALRT